MKKRRRKTAIKGKHRGRISISKINELDYVDVKPQQNNDDLLSKSLFERKNDHTTAVIYTDDIVNQAITTEKIAQQSIQTSHLQKDCVTEQVIADRSVGSKKIQPGAINDEHLGKGIVKGHHLADQSVSVEKLMDNPVLSVADKGCVIQQCGTAAFQYTELDELVEVEVIFEQPFANDSYVIVAMSNHPSCFTSLKLQTAQSATIQVTRTKFSLNPHGIISWIAIGNRLET